MNNIIYLSGPMTGLPDYGRANFNKAEKFLRETFGWKVLNPAVLPDDLHRKQYTPICLAMIQQADVIGMLPGWQNSRGAYLEHIFAMQTGKRVILLAEEYGFEC